MFNWAERSRKLGGRTLNQFNHCSLSNIRVPPLFESFPEKSEDPSPNSGPENADPGHAAWISTRESDKTETNSDARCYHSLVSSCQPGNLPLFFSPARASVVFHPCASQHSHTHCGVSIGPVRLLTAALCFCYLDVRRRSAPQLSTLPEESCLLSAATQRGKVRLFLQ